MKPKFLKELDRKLSNIDSATNSTNGILRNDLQKIRIEIDFLKSQTKTQTDCLKFILAINIVTLVILSWVYFQ